MYIFTPNTLIKSSEINANFAEFSSKGFVTPSSDWIAPTFQNSWVNYGSWATGAYRIDAMGYVHLKGLLKSGTLGANTPMFTLPIGFRPKASEDLILTGLSNNAVARINIRGSTGFVCCEVGNNIWVSIDGLTFKAES